MPALGYIVQTLDCDEWVDVEYLDSADEAESARAEWQEVNGLPDAWIRVVTD